MSCETAVLKRSYRGTTVMSTILTGVSLSNAAKRPLCTKGLREHRVALF